jgi:hypothetical protein
MLDKPFLERGGVLRGSFILDHAVDDNGIVGRLRFNRVILAAPSR